jgi:hypothetical protein
LIIANKELIFKWENQKLQSYSLLIKNLHIKTIEEKRLLRINHCNKELAYQNKEKKKQTAEWSSTKELVQIKERLRERAAN